MQRAVLRLARRLALPLAAVGALAASAPAALAACPNGDVAPTDPAAVAATLCLLNQQRAANGLGALTESTTLDRAADGFAADMVARGFFDHVSPGGGTMLDRIKAAGWVPGGAWSGGENIAWGSGSYGTPASIVDGWMHSAGHRANILDGAFRQIGLGIAGGAPQAGVEDAGTYVTDFASGDAATAANAKRRANPKRPATRCATRASARARVALVGHRAPARGCARR